MNKKEVKMIEKEVKTISRDELRELIASKKRFTLVDVLPKDHYEQEHIKGAISLPLEEIGKRAKTIFKAKDELIVVYCASFECPASTQAAQKLMSLGYTNVRDFKGGLQDYKQAGLPIETGIAKAARAGQQCTKC